MYFLICSSTSSWVRIHVSDPFSVLLSWALMMGLVSELLLPLILILVLCRTSFRFSIVGQCQKLAWKFQDFYWIRMNWYGIFLRCKTRAKIWLLTEDAFSEGKVRESSVRKVLLDARIVYVKLVLINCR